jgi:hypothetical protein
LARLPRIPRRRGRIARTLGLVALAASAAALCGCAGTTLSGDRTAQPAASSAPATTAAPTSRRERSAYLHALSREQARLGAAERAIARRPRTPAQLSRSIRLLASAIRRLGRDLAAITPPAGVRSEHARLAAIVRAYEVALERAARVALRPRGRPRGGDMLISATTAASSAFASTVAAIEASLRR